MKMLGYMTESEKDLYLFEKEHDLLMKRYNFLFESISAKANLQMEEAELKVMQESGDYDDLDMLYEASAAETGEKKQGIISQMIQAISKFIAGIFEKISKIFTKKDEEAYKANLKNMPNAQMDVNPKTLLAKLQKRFNMVVNKIKHPGIIKKNDDGSTTVDAKTGGVVITVGAGAILAAYFGGKKLLKEVKGFLDQKAELKEMKNTAGAGSSDDLMEAYKNYYDEVNEISKEASGLLNRCVGEMRRGLNTVKGAATTAIKTGIETGKKGASNVVNDVKNATIKAGKDAIKNGSSMNKVDQDEFAEESTSIFGLELGDDAFMENADYAEDLDEILSIMKNM